VRQVRWGAWLAYALEKSKETTNWSIATDKLVDCNQLAKNERASGREN
jgi:hypothetical protein